MKLRTKILLWLLPALVPLLMIIFVNYFDQSKTSKENILRLSSLAIEDGANELSSYLQLKRSTFKLLSSSFSKETSNSLKISNEADSKISLLMEMNPGFSLLVLTDVKGNILYNKMSLCKDDVYIHPRDIIGRTALNDTQIDFLYKQHETWKNSLPKYRSEISDTLKLIQNMTDIGQINSVKFRQAQHKVVTLTNLIENSPHSIFVGGKNLAIQAGLPFRSDSYIFAAPILSEDKNIQGYLLGVLDWTNVENKIFQIKSKLKNRGLPSTELVLFEKNQRKLLINSQKLLPNQLNYIISENGLDGGMFFIKDMQGFISYMPVKDISGLNNNMDDLLEIDNNPNLYITAYVPEHDVSDSLRIILYKALSFAILSILLFVGLVSYLSNKIVSPISYVSSQMKRASGGDFSSRIIVKQKDEIGHLVDSFNNMTERLEKNQKVLKEYTASLQISNEELKIAREQAEESTHAKSSFLARMSHEIRTPMNAIIGITYLALDTDPSPKVANYLIKIKDAADALLGIINDILDFSKVEANKLSLEKLNFNLEEVFDAVSDLIGLKAKEKGLEFIISINPDVPIDLIGDPLRVGQVLTNLANNAVKFTEKGEILIKVNLEEKDDQRVTLRFAVIDTGIGLSNDQIDRLFQSFSQADETTTRKFGGTGLGLAICKHLIELMGGKVWVESTLNKGSAFSFTANFGIGQNKQNDIQPVITDLQGIKVLVVDDNNTAQMVLSKMLISLSFDVTTASSGKEALRIIEATNAENTPYDLVLMDWMMPDLDGIEVSYRIKNNENMSKVPAILMVTAYDMEAAKQNEKIWSIDGFLTKPVKHSLLFDTIMKIFGGGFKERNSEHTAENKPYLILLESIAGAEVLLVEDNEINQLVACEMLEKTGVKITIAGNGLEALATLEEKEFDLVLMDIHMPELDGLEATMRIRSQDNYKNLPIVAMTANAMAEDREISLSAGMNDHITKPIDPEILMKTLIKWIKPGKRQSQVSNIPEKSNDEALPVLKNINVEKGLRKLGGNIKLYKKILQDFYSDYQQVSSNIYTDIVSGNYRNAQMAAHTLKGIAGNIAAEDLFETATNLEKALKKEQYDTAETIYAPFKDALSAVFTDLESLVESKSNNVQVTSNKINHIQAKNLYEKLRPLLEEGNLDATDFVTEIRDILATAETSSTVDTLVNQIENMDFDEALETLNKIAEIMDSTSHVTQ